MRHCTGSRIARLLGLTAVLLAFAPASEALTLVQLSGSGDIDVAVDGSIYLDTGGNALSSIVLSAGVASIGVGLPVSDAVLSLSGVEGYTGSFSNDVALELVSWQGGTLSVVASGTLFLVGDLALTPWTPGETCGGSGVVVSGSTPEPPLCRQDLDIGSGGTIEIVDLPGLPNVPEPSATLLFAIGLALVGPHARRRVRDGRTPAA